MLWSVFLPNGILAYFIDNSTKQSTKKLVGCKEEKHLIPSEYASDYQKAKGFFDTIRGKASWQKALGA